MILVCGTEIMATRKDRTLDGSSGELTFKVMKLTYDFGTKRGLVQLCRWRLITAAPVAWDKKPLVAQDSRQGSGGQHMAERCVPVSE